MTNQSIKRFVAPKTLLRWRYSWHHMPDVPSRGKSYRLTGTRKVHLNEARRFIDAPTSLPLICHVKLTKYSRAN